MCSIYLSYIQRMVAMIGLQKVIGYPYPITKSHDKDTGMAMALLLLILGFFTQQHVFFLLSIPVLVMDMAWPSFFRPMAICWFALSHMLGTIMTKVLLTIIFLILVTPVGCIRRVLGFDSLHLKNWKKDRTSVFKIRNQKVVPEDITKPF